MQEGLRKRRYGDLLARIGRKGSPITLVSPVARGVQRMPHTIFFRVFSAALVGRTGDREGRSNLIPDLRLMRNGD